MTKRLWLFFALPLFLIRGLMAADIDGNLDAILGELPAGDAVQVIGYLSAQADIEGLDLQLKSEGATLAERNRRVILALQETATATQPQMATFLDDLHSGGLVEEYRMYWVANLFWAKVKEGAIEQLRSRDDIYKIYFDYEIEGAKPLNMGPGEDLIATHEIGLTRINAPAAWAMGWTGAGRVVMNIDTGVDGNHEALQSRFRGDVDGDGDVDESWFDPYTTNYPNPRDDGGHGTHTMGTICGRSPDGDTIGVAIDAQWIAAAAIDRGGGIPRTVSDAIASFQWAVDPDGDPRTQDNPDAIGNSWGVTTGHGYPPCDETFWAVIDNCEAAGSVVVFSAGNEGPNPNTLRRPADRGTTPLTCFSVGAVNGGNQNLPIAGFSSRGPSDCGPNGEEVIKPEVVAPGVQVRSSWPGGSYINLDGTSMASPHVTGAVAVIRQVNPNLDADGVKRALMETAVDLPASNPDGEDNTYGMGIIDLYEACIAAQSGYGYIEGFVRDGGNNPLQGARVTVVGSPYHDDSDTSGAYLIALPAETTYTIEASLFGFIPADTLVAVIANDTANADFTLQIAPGGSLHGTVTDAVTSGPIPGATVEILNTPINPDTTDQIGYYEFTAIPGGSTYTIRVRATGHALGQDTIYVPVGGSAELNFSLEGLESFELNDGVWNGTGSWEWGQPTSGPNSAYDGTNVWATNLSGNYDNNSNDYLYSFYFTINDAVDTLTFFHWYEFQDGYDGGNVSISLDDGDTWTLLTPIDGYPSDQVDALDNGPGYTGANGAWQQAMFELIGYQGMLVHFRFRLGTNVLVTRPGWYIDAVNVKRATSWAERDAEIAVNPLSFNVSLVLGDSASFPLTISNSGDGILVYELMPITTMLLSHGGEMPLPSNIADETDFQTDILEEKLPGDISNVQKGAKHESRPNPPMTLDSGGPDEFGYLWLDSNEPNGPTFSWVDISGFGQEITMTDDQNSGPFNLGFEMPFYDALHSSIRVCSNGWISFSSTSQSYNNANIPNTGVPNELIAGFWEDLDPSSGGTIYFYTNNSDSAIVSWVAVPNYNSSGDYTFEIILFGNGNIAVQYETMGGALNSCSIGIENLTGTVGLQVVFNQDYVSDGLALLFKCPQDWLQVSPNSDRVMPGGSSQATVTFNAADLDVGQYTGYISATSNDQNESTVVVPCTLNVGPVGIDEAPDNLPVVFGLNQNYPNPFNPTTQISFSIPGPTRLDLTVYDIAGRKVKRLAGGILDAGFHTVTWDGTDEELRPVSSGLYFFKLSSQKYSASRKMLLIR
jgi:bacillopeptidase F